MATWAIGDLQGCHDEFRALLDEIRFDPARDRLWLTGDLVNRGPGSLAALRHVKSLAGAATVVLGNHDLHLLAVAAGAGRGPRRGDTLDDVLRAPDGEELVAWLRGRPLFHEDRALGWAMVHAGLPPQWDLALAAACAREVEAALAADPRGFFAAMYGDEPDRWSPSLAGVDRLRFTVNCLTRLRFCTADGRLVLKPKGPPGSAPAGALPWFRVPGRRSAGRRIAFGHWSSLGWHVEGGAYSLDSGCVWGGELTAIRLDANGARTCVRCRGAARIGAGE